MSRELIFTSAPRGVRPGSSGFCTVAYTQGMPASLIQQLESLSGYRQLFSPQDPKASLNPIAFSHLTLAVAGRRCHVLSRICDAGLDYTQRTNKFAHHVVLDAAEVPSAGPAWLLAQPGFTQNKWAGEPGIRATGPVVPSGEFKPRVCHAWQQLAGDAGWAGVLAETTAGPTNRQAVLIFQPGMDMLPLLAESLTLLPPELRWRISFSTYFTKLPVGIDCQWRCVADGTPEAVAARRAPQAALVIDFCRPLGRAAGGAYVEVARTGRKPAAKTTAVQLSDVELEDALRGNGGLSIPPDVDLPVPLGAAGSGRNVVPPPISSQPQRRPKVQLLNPKRERRPRWPRVLAAVAAVVVFVASVFSVWVIGTGKRAEIAGKKRAEESSVPTSERAEVPKAVPGSKRLKEKAADAIVAKDKDARGKTAEKEFAVNTKKVGGKVAADKGPAKKNEAVEQKTPDKNKQPAENGVAGKKAQEEKQKSKAEACDPLHNIRNKACGVPQYRWISAAGGSQPSLRFTLVRLPVTEARCDISLVSSDGVFPDGWKIRPLTKSVRTRRPLT